MSSSKSGINPTVFFLSLTDLIFQKLRLKKNKIHDFTGCVPGSDYVFEIAEDPAKGYITAQRKGVRCGDYIILQIDSEHCRYQVEQIDYYSNPSDMWMALVKKVV
ncbi:MAG: hypothetical protein VKN72_25425 [Nostocales cyanobacterium 94392]|nr:hypothetical protein [Nostocales cyanobacterium 94392]